MTKLHVIEPTLRDETGHCCSYVTHLLQGNAKTGFAMTVWIDHHAKDLLPGTVKIKRYFFRQFRRVQQLFLYGYLLFCKQAFFVPTSGRIDLEFLNILAKLNFKVDLAFLHFHQFKRNEKKLKRLRNMPALHNTINILVPTKKLAQLFLDTGFKKVSVAPCFTYQPEKKSQEAIPFKKLLFAGAARTDKGFPAIVDFIFYLINQNEKILFECQVSPPYSGRYDTQSLAGLQKLETLSLPWLVLHKETLGKAQYLGLFSGAICVLPYDENAYADKFSAVLLDALLAGCPAIVPNNTWMSEVVNRFSAGIVVADAKPESLFAASQQIKENYAVYCANARQAGEVLRQEHAPETTLQLIKQRLDLLLYGR